MEEPKYTIDLRTNNGWWARLQSWFVGGRLVTPNQGSQTGPVSAHGHLGDSSINDERIPEHRAALHRIRFQPV